jgi:hypothetical protein
LARRRRWLSDRVEDRPFGFFAFATAHFQKYSRWTAEELIS